MDTTCCCSPPLALRQLVVTHLPVGSLSVVCIYSSTPKTQSYRQQTSCKSEARHFREDQRASVRQTISLHNPIHEISHIFRYTVTNITLFKFAIAFLGIVAKRFTIRRDYYKHLMYTQCNNHHCTTISSSASNSSLNGNG